MKKHVVLLALVAIMATLFLTNCQEEETFQPEIMPGSLFLATDAEDTYLFSVSGNNAVVVNDNTVGVKSFGIYKDYSSFTLSNNVTLKAYALPFYSTSYSTSKDYKFNGLFKAENFLIIVKGEDNVRIFDLSDSKFIFVNGLILNDPLTAKVGWLVLSIKKLPDDSFVCTFGPLNEVPCHLLTP